MRVVESDAFAPADDPETVSEQHVIVDGGVDLLSSFFLLLSLAFEEEPR